MLVPGSPGVAGYDKKPAYTRGSKPEIGEPASPWSGAIRTTAVRGRNRESRESANGSRHSGLAHSDNRSNLVTHLASRRRLPGAALPKLVRYQTSDHRADQPDSGWLFRAASGQRL